MQRILEHLMYSVIDNGQAIYYIFVDVDLHIQTQRLFFLIIVLKFEKLQLYQ